MALSLLPVSWSSGHLKPGMIITVRALKSRYFVAKNRQEILAILQVKKIAQPII